MNGSRIKVFLFVLITVLIIMAIGDGILAINFFKPKETKPTTTDIPKSSLTPVTNKQASGSFFSSQSAATTGKILAVKGNLLTIENINHEKQEFPAAKSVSIFLSSPGKPSTPSADLKKITLNKPALINFSTEEGKWVVSSIFFSENPSSVAPVDNSAQKFR